MIRMSSINLTPTSYLILGLIARDGAKTPYGLEAAAEWIGTYWWTFPHSQLYAEPARLARAGLLVEHREDTGRRRRTYDITDAGRQALRDWIAEPKTPQPQLRDLGMLKLYFARNGTPDDVVRLGREQAEMARRMIHLTKEIIEELEALGDRPHQAEVAEMGLRVSAAFAEVWDDIADRYEENPVPKRTATGPAVGGGG